MPQQIPIREDVKKVLLSDIPVPSITTWNRLEGRPRREDFDRTLRAEVRDPLWMLCRQWQFGEFKGEDAGSAVEAKTQVATARLNRYAGRTLEATGYDDAVPLETRVEREPIPLDLLTRARIGRRWARLIAGINGALGLYLGEFGFAEPAPGSEEEAHLRGNRKALQTFTLLRGRVVDGGKLLRAMRSTDNGDEHSIWLEQQGLQPGPLGQLLIAAEDLVSWFERVYSEPAIEDDPTWADEYMEYRFGVAAPDAAGDDGAQTDLLAEQYQSGSLDWYSFNIESRPDLRLTDKADAQIDSPNLSDGEPISFVLNSIEFGGMPNVRWWEFEDRKVDFGNINPSTTDLATLVLAEFGLIYGNDWSVIPYHLATGTLAQIPGVVVKDVFGVRTFIRHAATGGDDQERWGMYYLDTNRPGLPEDGSSDGSLIDSRLFLPPVVSKLQESTPIEKVILIRDEMANMVWGIEEVIPDLARGGRTGFEAATELQRFLLDQLPEGGDPDLIDSGAAIRYRLGNMVPENWIPFVPVHEPDSKRDIRLQRAGMPAAIGDRIVEPRGTILGAEGPLFINEGEAPRAGAVVSRTFQRARWWDGRVFTWIGRRKRTGRGQGSSGLEFDRILPLD